MTELSWYEDPSSGGSQFLRGLLGAVGGVASRHKFGNILMSGLRGGLYGAREGVADDGTEGGGGYLEALLNVPAGWGYASHGPQGPTAQPGGMLQEGFGGPGSALGYLAAPGALALNALQTGNALQATGLNSDSGYALNGAGASEVAPFLLRPGMDAFDDILRRVDEIYGRSPVS